MVVALPFDLYVVTDPSAPRGLSPYLEALDAGIEGWALCVRHHDGDDDAITRSVETLATRGRSVPRLIAAADLSRVRLAARLGVGIQLAERAPAADEARLIAGGNVLVLASIHDAVGGERRAREGVDAALLAPFGAVRGKGPPLDDDAVVAITRTVDVPVLALGAIRRPEDVVRALALGCAGIAVRSFLAEASDGARALASVRGWIDTARQERDSPRGSR